MKENASRDQRPWELGSSLPEGYEWLATTFGDQPTVDMDGDRLEHLLTSSDESWMAAYARMNLDQNHAWMRHSKSEAEFLSAFMPKNGLAVDVSSLR